MVSPRRADGIFLFSRDTLSILNGKYYISPEKRQTLSVIKAVTTKENIFIFPRTKSLVYLIMPQYIHRNKSILNKPQLFAHAYVCVCARARATFESVGFF